jgi:large subunit ribosomal protein L14
MLQKRSRLKVADNTGAFELEVIGIPGYGRKRFANLGNLITCTVKGANPNGVVKDHEIVKAVIVRTRKETGRPDGSYVRFSDNAAVIIDKDKNPRGTRIFGPVAREIKELGFSKIASQAEEVV